MTSVTFIFYFPSKQNINPVSPLSLLQAWGNIWAGCHLRLLSHNNLPILIRHDCSRTNVYFGRTWRCKMVISRQMGCHHFHQLLLLPSHLHSTDFSQMPQFRATSQNTFTIWNKLPWPDTTDKIKLARHLNKQCLSTLLILHNVLV